MTRLRACYIAVIASLMLASGAHGEPAAGGSSFEECMVQKTKAACDLSEEACTRFLSESGQRHATRACQQAERFAEPQHTAEPQPVAPADHQQPPAQRNAHSQPAAPAEIQQAPAGKRMRYRPVNAAQAETQPESAQPLSQKQPVVPADRQPPPVQRNARSQPVEPPRMDENLRPQPPKKRQQQEPEQQKKRAARPAGDEPFWSRGRWLDSEAQWGASAGQR